MTKAILSQAYLKEFLDYNQDTGIVTWKKRSGHRRSEGEAGYLGRGYRCIGINGDEYFAHRLIWCWMTGEWPKGDIDHINHIGDDNRWSNLREVPHLDNGRNMSKKKSNKSGITGVFWSKKNKKWTAQISVDGKAKHLGFFAEIEDAAACRLQANIEYGFHANHGAAKNGAI